VSNTGIQTRPFLPSAAETGFFWLHRIVAVYCLASGVLYWVRLIGIYEGALWRFDLMPVHWQVVAIVLAALFPVAAVGLWMTTSWGPVIWFICAATEVIMFAGFPELYGERWAVVGAHAGVAFLYTALRLTIYFQKRPFQ
jgi:hypothetical protein